MQSGWHPESLAARMPFLHRRGVLTRATRAFFSARGYTEVETPYAVTTPGEEVHLRAFRTERETPDNSRHALWLHTSPEFAMKKLLVAGVGPRSEEHTSELQSHVNLVCRLLLEKKNNTRSSFL